jgi:hypothetical protein
MVTAELDGAATARHAVNGAARCTAGLWIVMDTPEWAEASNRFAQRSTR